MLGLKDFEDHMYVIPMDISLHIPCRIGDPGCPKSDEFYRDFAILASPH